MALSGVPMTSLNASAAAARRAGASDSAERIPAPTASAVNSFRFIRTFLQERSSDSVIFNRTNISGTGRSSVSKCIPHKGAGAMNLNGRVAIVTGGATGIGRAIAETFAREGGRVVVNYSKSRDAAEEVVKGIRASGGTAVAIAADVSKQSDAHALMSAAEREF